MPNRELAYEQRNSQNTIYNSEVEKDVINQTPLVEMQVSSYNNATDIREDKTADIINRLDPNNPYSGKSFGINNSNKLNPPLPFKGVGHGGYVTKQGVFKAYSTSGIVGKNECPVFSGTKLSNEDTETYKYAKSLKQGTALVSGQTCGNEGANVYTSKLISNPTKKYVGCYNDKYNPLNKNNLGVPIPKDGSVSLISKIKSKTVFGSKMVDECTKYAAENNYQFFSMQKNADSTYQCTGFNSSNRNDYDQYNNAALNTKITSLSVLSSSSGVNINTNENGIILKLLNTGQIQLFDSGSSNVKITVPSNPQTMCTNSGNISIVSADFSCKPVEGFMNMITSNLSEGFSVKKVFGMGKGSNNSAQAEAQARAQAAARAQAEAQARAAAEARAQAAARARAQAEAQARAQAAARARAQAEAQARAQAAARQSAAQAAAQAAALAAAQSQAKSVQAAQAEAAQAASLNTQAANAKITAKKTLPNIKLYQQQINEIYNVTNPNTSLLKHKMKANNLGSNATNYSNTAILFGDMAIRTTSMADKTRFLKTSVSGAENIVKTENIVKETLTDITKEAEEIKRLTKEKEAAAAAKALEVEKSVKNAAAKAKTKLQGICDNNLECSINLNDGFFGISSNERVCDPDTSDRYLSYSYNCGSTLQTPLLLNLKNPTTTNTSINCSRYIDSNCTFFLFLNEDNGKIELYKGTPTEKLNNPSSYTGATPWPFGPAIWQSNNIKPTSIIPNPNWVSELGKSGKNYLSQKNILSTNEWIGSKNGNFRIIMINGNLELQTLSLDSGCDSNTNLPIKPDIHAIYKINEYNPNNMSSFNKLAYIDSDSQLMEYSTSAITKSNNYISYSNYDTNQANNISTSYSKSSIDQCETECNNNKNCSGYVYDSKVSSPNVKNCFLKQGSANSIFQNKIFTDATSTSQKTLYIKKPQINPNILSKCNKNIVDIDTLKFVKYNKINGNITADTKIDCNMVNEITMPYVPVNYISTKMDTKSSDITSHINTITGKKTDDISLNSNMYQMGINNTEMISDVPEYQNNTEHISGLSGLSGLSGFTNLYSGNKYKEGMTTLSQNLNLNDVKGMLNDSDIRILQANYSYIMWSVLAVGILSVTMNTINK